MSQDLWKRGQPTKYHTGLCEDLVRRMSSGETNVWVCAAWDISETTFYDWLRTYPELQEAYSIGQPKCQVWWEQYGKDMMEGKKDEKGFKPWIAVMNAKFKYNANPNLPSSNTIHINNMNVLSLNQKDIDSEITKLLEKYPTELPIDVQSD